MAKPEWGHKRTCQSCGCRFYDLKHVPIICPKCGSTVEPDVPFKVRRAGGVPIETKVAIPAAVAAEIIETEADDLVESVADDDAVDSEDAAEEDEASLIEDASDLGEDDDDMAEVMEHMDEGLEDEV
ncbi:TIGR02300 family protein [Magnetospirillum molischianum]|uniref:TIGR02300 family protein n=1 Tax=Magnetospirillum molischianum DSM 120 TaxID=1150626 RepID=H8FW99_MAGML|nr:TIGR02300 family protein [Magnetospirillum molischianum]CCG42637.1 conserved hypothetical protein [Magnetospirillum molischianum DSM 120]